MVVKEIVMRLSDLIKDIEVVESRGDLNIPIKDVVIDSKEVMKGSLFICIEGEVSDGHDFAKQAFHYGASAIIAERETGAPLPQIIVKNSRIAMSKIAATFYGNANKELKIIGVTGTNGKTTTSFMIRSLLEFAKVKTALIGTLGTFYGNKKVEQNLTTPDPLFLHKLFADMVKEGVKVVVMEVSAHALSLFKLEGIRFETVVFTNLSQDHLDYFKTMQEYKNAKLKLFERGRFNYAVVNSDDPVGLEMFTKIEAIGYGIDNPADVFAIKVQTRKNCTEFVINLFDKICAIKIPYIGKFNVENALAAATVCALYGVPTDTIFKGLNSLPRVEGRLELVYSDKFNVYVDYAHTPDGLLKTLSALRSVTKNKIICLFGCGGNRDKSKRSIMGKISLSNADFTVITSDNPRYEEPMDIISDIEEGAIKVSKNYVVVQDRGEAIEYAINMAEKNDSIIIAGKGSERYQEILGIKHVFSDKDIVREILKGDD